LVGLGVEQVAVPEAGSTGWAGPAVAARPSIEKATVPPSGIGAIAARSVVVDPAIAPVLSTTVWVTRGAASSWRAISDRVRFEELAA
jgi:hypothetical protein